MRTNCPHASASPSSRTRASSVVEVVCITRSVGPTATPERRIFYRAGGTWGIAARRRVPGSPAEALRRAGTMTWRGLRADRREATAVYERGMWLTKAALRPDERLTRPPALLRKQKRRNPLG